MSDTTRFAQPGDGPIDCVRGEPAARRDAKGRPTYGAGCGEPRVLRGTTIYCATCGRSTGIATVDDDGSPAEMRARAAEQREQDRGTVIGWRLGST